MATILVRNVDELVVEALKAKAHGRSMEAEVRAVLAEAADPGDLTGEALVAFLTSGPEVTEDFVLDIPDDRTVEPNPFLDPDEPDDPPSA